MKEWKPLNMQLRSWVISQVLRLEQSSTNALRAIFRLFNENSKTLGSQSSALSFKAKIDLLLDLEEITKTEYSHLLKLMEIRNQFAHNPAATSFEELDNINPDINKYLLKYESENADKDQPLETRLKTIFSQLFQVTVGKLLVVEIEYTKGMEKEIRRHLNDKIVENIDALWDRALQRSKDRRSETPTLFILNNSDDEIQGFYYDFMITMSEFTQVELDAIGGDNLKTVFKQKMPTEEIFKKLGDEKSKEV